MPALTTFLTNIKYVTKILTRNINKRSAPRDHFEQTQYFGRKKCYLKFNEKEAMVSTPVDLLNFSTPLEKNVEHVFCSDDLVTPAAEINTGPSTAMDEFENSESSECNFYDMNRFLENDLEPPMGHTFNKDSVTWNNMFDAELFGDNFESGENMNGASTNHLMEGKLINTEDTLPETFIKPKVKTTKRKNNDKATARPVDPPKKKEKIANASKNIYRKERFTKTVKNWLNDVEQTLADITNQSEEQLHNVIENNGKIESLESNLSKKKVPRKAVEKKTIKESSTIGGLDTNSRKEIAQKKVVQAQLANKDGKMKFGKPKNVPVADDKNDSVSAKPEITREKKTKSKFIAPIKSQVSVKDITFEIRKVERNNMHDYASSLKMIENAEICVVLTYSNGFCQLNSCYTEDTCVPEGLMVSLADDECFYYFSDFDDDLRTLLFHLLEHNTVICFEGKSILIFLSHYKLDSVKPISFMDTKIAGALLEPDSPPDTFSGLQRLAAPEQARTAPSPTAEPNQRVAWWCSQLRALERPLRAKLLQNDLWNLFVDIEMPLLPIIADMESVGVAVDMERLRAMEQQVAARLRRAEQRCHAAAGRSFQLNSALQLRTLLYDELKLDAKGNVRVRETLVTGAKSTSEATLRSLMSAHELPRWVLEYRRLHKAHSTFLAGIAQHVRDGVVRPTWVQTAAATGRIASNNPNLQAIPKAPFSLSMFPEPDDVDNPVVNFRSVYVAREGCSLLAADFRHVECRVFAHAAADAALQRALDCDDDLFRALAAQWLGKAAGAVSAAERERTKRVVYASMYGCGARRLADLLALSYDHALQLLSSFDKTLPSLKGFARSVAAQCAAAGGRVRTPSGRTRTLRDAAAAPAAGPAPAPAPDAAAQAHAQRQALNFIIQGSAADACKRAMRGAAARVRGRARLLLQLHDELVWEVEDHHLRDVAVIVKEEMERSGPVRLPVTLAAGRCWADLQPLLLD